MQSSEFNTYGARRGHDSVMARGTFANIRLVNKFMDRPGPLTKHWPDGETVGLRQSYKNVSEQEKFNR